MRLSSIRLLTLLAIGAISIQARAQAAPELEQAVQLIATNTFAISTGQLSYDAMLRQAYDARTYVGRLPALMPAPELQSLEVQLQLDVSRMVGFVEAQDFNSARSAAEDLLSNLTRFRSLIGMPL